MYVEPGSDALSERQRDLLELAVCRARDGWGFPTIRELCVELDISSTNGVADHLIALTRKGYIERHGRSEARGRRLTNKTRRLYGLPLLPLPTVGLRSAA